MRDGPDLFDWITTCKSQIFNHLNRQTNSHNRANVWQTGHWPLKGISLTARFFPGRDAHGPACGVRPDRTVFGSLRCTRAQTFQ